MAVTTPSTRPLMADAAAKVRRLRDALEETLRLDDEAQEAIDRLTAYGVDWLGSPDINVDLWLEEMRRIEAFEGDMVAFEWFTCRVHYLESIERLRYEILDGDPDHDRLDRWARLHAFETRFDERHPQLMTRLASLVVTQPDVLDRHLTADRRAKHREEHDALERDIEAALIAMTGE